MTLVAGPAFGVSDSSTRPMGGGRTLQANAWECNLWVRACDWKTSSKAFNAGGSQVMTWVKNQAVITGKGGDISIQAGSVGVGVSGGDGSHSFTWTNNNAYISDLSGQARAGLFSFTWGIETCSYASAYHRALGIHGTASACAG
jgi:hypothetical protein